MRVFVGIDLPPAVREAVNAHVSAYTNRLPPSRWVRMDGYHLTLVFIGEISDSATSALDPGLASAVLDQDSFPLQLRRAGCFPSGSRPARIAWIGVDDQQSICQLQDRVARKLENSGLIEPQNRSYQPHLTVARCRKPWNRNSAEEWECGLPGELGEEFQVDSIALFRSRLSLQGARYEKIQTYPFGGAR